MITTFPSGLSPVAFSFCESYIVIFLSQAAPDLFRQPFLVCCSPAVPGLLFAKPLLICFARPLQIIVWEGNESQKTFGFIIDQTAQAAYLFKGAVISAFDCFGQSQPVFNGKGSDWCFSKKFHTDFVAVLPHFLYGN